jgi:protein dithiol oxidoreductase (disulfide-forming)
MKLITTTLTGLALFLVPALSQAGFTEGRHFVILDGAKTCDSPLSVLEFFGYRCEHCMAAEPAMQRWTQNAPEAVTLIKIPVVFRDSWEPFARAFYTAKYLGVSNQAHTKMFEAVHNDKSIFDTADTFAKWYESYGVDRSQFLALYSSNVVSNALNKGLTQSKNFSISSTPTWIVGRRFRFTTKSAGGVENVPQLLTYLVKQCLMTEIQLDTNLDSLK